MDAPVRVLPSGPQAVLVEYDSLEAVMRATARLQRAAPPGVVDLVPAARTLLVVTRAPGDLAGVTAALESMPSADDIDASSLGTLVEIEVLYDGPDLHDVAERCHLAVDEVIARHAAPEYAVAFCGFRPGFAYLVGLDRALHLPRRSTPRTRVPAGAVAIASEFTAVYPSVSPGGWHLLGHTDAVMWDEAREVAALLPPGTRVRFVPR